MIKQVQSNIKAERRCENKIERLKELQIVNKKVCFERLKTLVVVAVVVVVIVVGPRPNNTFTVLLQPTFLLQTLKVKLLLLLSLCSLHEF